MLDNQFCRQFDNGGEEWRDDLARDYDIVLYSSAWRRLRGVTQVTPITEGLTRTHDRLIHSLKVSQVGERMAQWLKIKYPQQAANILPEAVKVAGMTHDLGHPPFGHVAEKELQSCLTKSEAPYNERWNLDDSFEGNAQTFRILTRLSHKSLAIETEPSGGMRLTAATLAAGMKYPWGFMGAKKALDNEYDPALERYYARKWGYYSSDEEAWLWVKRNALPTTGTSNFSINAKIMDLADDVTYAVHDVHDYFRMGFIPLHEIGAGLDGAKNDEFREFMKYARPALMMKPELHMTAESLEGAQDWLKQLAFPPRAYSDTEKDRQALHRFESQAVREVQRVVRLGPDGELEVPENISAALELMKELTWFYVINHPYLAASQEGQRRIVRDLHLWLCAWADECESNDPNHGSAKTERNRRRLPSRFRELLAASRNDRHLSNDGRISRAAVDFIVGLTDAEAANLHQHMGGATGSVSPVTWL